MNRCVMPGWTAIWQRVVSRKARTTNATMRGFRLKDWIEFFTQEFNVLTTSLVLGEYRLDSLVNKYEQMVQLLEEKSQDDKRMQGIKDRVMGPNLIKFASAGYWQWK